MAHAFSLPCLFMLAILSLMPLQASAQSDSSPENERAKAAVYAGNYAQALSIWTVMAEQGDPIAMNNLGHLYATGKGVPLSLTRAFTYFKAAADHPKMTKPQAAYNVGHAYMKGRGVAIDEDLAVQYLDKAASKEIPNAYADLGKYYFGPGVMQDKDKAFTYFRKGAFRRDPESAFWAGYISVAGEIEEADYEVGRIYLEQAAQSKYTEAYFLLGILAEFDFKNGGPREPAIEWFEMAKAAGNTEAAAHLAAIAAVPVPKVSKGLALAHQGRHTEAIAQFGADCTSGDGAACYEQGLYYANGVHVPQDLVKAYMTLEKACDDNVGRSCVDYAKAVYLLKAATGLSHRQRALSIFKQDCDKDYTAWDTCLHAAEMTWDDTYWLQDRGATSYYGEAACNRVPPGKSACWISNRLSNERISKMEREAAKYRKPSKPSFMAGLAQALVSSAGSYNSGASSYQSNPAQLARDRHAYVMSTYNKNSINYGRCATVNSPGC